MIIFGETLYFNLFSSYAIDRFIGITLSFNQAKSQSVFIRRKAYIINRRSRWTHRHAVGWFGFIKITLPLSQVEQRVLLTKLSNITKERNQEKKQADY